MDIVSRLLDVAVYVLFICIGYFLRHSKTEVRQEEPVYIAPTITVEKETTKKKEDEEELNSFFN